MDGGAKCGVLSDAALAWVALGSFAFEVYERAFITKRGLGRRLVPPILARGAAAAVEADTKTWWG